MDTPKIELVDDFLNMTEKDVYLKHLKSLPYKPIKLQINGREFIPKRKCISYADNNVLYTYSNFTAQPQEWTPEILALKTKVEKHTKEDYNYALINFYEDGGCGIGMHYDREKELNPMTSIPTLSFGAKRKILFTASKKHPYSVELKSGSLLVMDPSVNTTWKHGIPVDTSIKSPRYSITFRNILPKQQQKRKLDNEKFSDPLYNDGKKFALNDEIFVSIAPFNDEIKIHFRRFERGVIPTCDGVSMDVETFFYFVKNLRKVHLVYKTESFIANNKITALSTDDGLLIKELSDKYNMKMNYILISPENLQIYREKENTIIDYILEMQFRGIFITQLWKLAGTYSDILKPSLEEQRVMHQKLCEILRTSLTHAARKHTWCFGCAHRRDSQFEHSCCASSPSELLSDAGSKTILLVDYKAMASELAKSEIKISQPYFENLSISEFKQMCDSIM